MYRNGFKFLSLFWLVWITISTESRYIDTSVSDTAEDDVDLEEALSDYYDNLMEIWSRVPKEEEEEKQEEKVKPKRGRGMSNYPEWMAPSDPELSENETKSYFDLTVPIKIGNFTFRFLNESYAANLDMQRANRERENEGENSTRIKHMRINSIKDSLLRLRGGESHESSPTEYQKKTLREMYEKQMKEKNILEASNKYAEKSQSFYPSCDLPKNTDEALWSDPYSMNLFFDVYFPTPQQDSTLFIVNAILKLYTVNQGNTTSISENAAASHLEEHLNQNLLNIPNYGLVNDDEKRIRISVYWHTKSLKRQRVKRKLLDSRMMSLNGDNSLSFDIRPAVRSWKKSSKNFGLLVIVEDENGTLHKPADYIHSMNCSKWAATLKPLPMFGFDSATQIFIRDSENVEERNITVNDTNHVDENRFFAHQSVRYPILGLQMREVSQSEIQNLMKLKSAQMEIASGYYNVSVNQDKYNRWGNHDSRSRITDFENVPLGLPLARNQDVKSEASGTKIKTYLDQGTENKGIEINR